MQDVCILHPEQDRIIGLLAEGDLEASLHVVRLLAERKRQWAFTEFERITRRTGRLHLPGDDASSPRIDLGPPAILVEVVAKVIGSMSVGIDDPVEDQDDLSIGSVSSKRHFADPRLEVTFERVFLSVRQWRVEDGDGGMCGFKSFEKLPGILELGSSFRRGLGGLGILATGDKYEAGSAHQEQQTGQDKATQA
jgi:hypothetical protein